MAIRILPNNSITIGDYLLYESNTGLEFTGKFSAVASNLVAYSPLYGTVAGYTAGGGPLLNTPAAQQNTIDKFPFATNANATDVGDLTQGRYEASGQSSEVSGYASGGFISPPSLGPPGPAGTVNTIDKFPFATNANATDVGDLSQTRSYTAGQSSKDSGYTSGGTTFTPPATNTLRNTIDKFPFASNANATDVGDLTQARGSAAGQSSLVSGYTSGGFTTVVGNIIDKFPFATNANASDVGDLTVARNGTSGQSSTESGYASGGNGPTPGVGVNTIDKFPFATNANATDVGDLSVTIDDATGQSSYDSGYASGGMSPSFTALNTIDKFPFASNANATDVGDLTVARYSAAGQQD